ncbi:PadR family transcriptional regulator [Kineosporia sp. J2-2]|uniref:PadR family transcriptional regulator n=1 Tax=Kineosporia corallincola TaxID=2835133 RepID=A0ABS5TMB5_9ACTN|nr:PadR family transcriptional regulator [Kineosporia corallincola]MBT0770739.1 PadR family transcriptional regulator [Kineosporia corallincola]
MATGDALLALLLPGPRHGYDLKRAHDEWFSGLRPLAFGQVYSTLARLQRDALIQVVQTETADGPERTVYELTEPGRTQVMTWLAEPVDPAGPGGPPADELIRKTLAAYRLGADPNGVMARQRAVHLRAIRALESSTEGEPEELVGQAVSRDHRRLHLDADLRWLELAGDRMRRRPAPVADRLSGPVPAGPLDGAGHPEGAEE